MGDNRPSVYAEGDNIIYRASALGSCVKYLVASYLGYEDQRGQKMDDLLDRSANEGNLHEAAVIEKLRESEGLDVILQQEEINIQIIPKVFVRGHCEGILNYPDKPNELLEIKSMSTKQFAKWQNHKFGAFDRYAWQISAYMQNFPDYDVRYIVKRREDGFITELSIPANQPPIPLSVIRKKVLTAERYRRKMELPPCDTTNQWGCPVWYLHDEEEDDKSSEPLTEEMVAILGELAKEYRELKAIEDAGKVAEESRKKINPELLNMLGKLDQGVGEYEGRKFQVTRRKGGGKRIDRAKAEEILGDRIEEIETAYRYEYPIVKEITE